MINIGLNTLKQKLIKRRIVVRMQSHKTQVSDFLTHKQHKRRKNN